MSAFAVIYERSNTPIEPGVFERMMERLSHRGPDGNDVLISGHIALGHWHFWSTPEDVGECQPLAITGLPFRIVLDGRIDNREELFTKLSIKPAEGIALSDAALILHAYAHWGEHCFEHFVGEFALVIFDEEHNELICARDQLGDRTLFYSAHGTQIIIASEAWAVAGINNSNPELNEGAIAHYFALKVKEDGQTFFNNVYELLPAHRIIFTSSRQSTLRYWQPDPNKKIRYKTDKEYADHFRSLLKESTRCRMRSSTPVGILMSGGLDSTSIACLAASMIAPQQLTTISYVFDELPDCDERQYIDAVKELWNTQSIQISCDDAWPYKNWENWHRNPSQPEGNPYRLLKERAYQRAYNEGLRVLLTGGFGDHLYDGMENWMADLLADGRIFQAMLGLAYHIHHFGLRRALSAQSLRHVAKRILNMIPGSKHLHTKKSDPYPWLTSYSINAIENANSWLDPAFELKTNLLGLRAAKSCSSEIFNANRQMLELRNPYRDRRLVEFMLAIPAYQFYFRGVYKYILRIAMQGILPEIIRTRQKKTSLISLFSRGVEREKELLQEYTQDPNAHWRKYVKSDWLLDRWNSYITPDIDGPQAVVPWLCFSFESW